MKQTKRLLSSFLTLCLLLGLLPTTAWAASALEITQQPTADNNYTVKATCEGAITNTVTILSQEEQATAEWLENQDHMLTLGPEKVTVDNAENILGDGKASFALVDGMPTLTLNGVNVTEGIEEGGGTIGLTCSNALTIVLAEGSDNNITISGMYVRGIVTGDIDDSLAPLTVTGKGKLTLSASASGMLCFGVMAGNIQVTGGAELTVKAASDRDPAECVGLNIDAGGKLQVSDGGVMRISSTAIAAAFGNDTAQIVADGYSIQGSTAVNDFGNLTDAELGEWRGAPTIVIGDEVAKSVLIAPAEPAHSNHPVCGAACSHGGAHGDVTWKELTAAMLNSSEPLPSGHYYLANDITVPSISLGKINTMRNVDLCLNGHTLTCTLDKGEGYRSISVFYDCTWNICDCGEGGQIAFSGNKGFGIQISYSSALNLYGGKLVTEKKELIKNAGTVNLYGGGVTAQTYSISIDPNEVPAALTLSGAPEVSGSLLLQTTAGTSVADAKVDATNYTGNTLTVEEGSLTDTKVGAYAIKGGNGKFTLTNAGYEYQYKSGGLMIYKPHAHTWAATWSTNGTGHWHACTVAGCALDYATCGEAGAEYGAHVYTDDQDTTCDTCNYTRTVTPPDAGEVKGEVETKPGAPQVEVGTEALKELAGTPQTGETVTVTLTVEKKAENAAEGAAEIKNMATGKTVDFLDLSLVKTVTGGSSPGSTTITNAAKVLEIVVSYDFSGKKDVTVYRKHGAENAVALDELTSIPGTPADGKFYADRVGGKLYIYAAKFSTYAIGYTPEGGGGNSGSGGSSSSGGSSGGGSSGGGWSGGSSSSSGGSSSSGSGGSVTDKPAPGEVSSCLRDKTCPVWSYTDASVSAWYHDGIHYCVQNGLMVGTDSTHFSPGTTASRAMIAAILWRLEGGPKAEAVQPFSDVADDRWYTQAIAWAAETGVVKGYGEGRFGPNDPITREQLASLLWRYAGNPAAADLPLSFTDAGEASGYAQDALRWAVDQGILTGKGGGVLDPRGMATRAEAAQMLMRFCLSRK